MARRPKRRGSGLAWAALLEALAALAMAGVVGLGAQRGWWTSQGGADALPAIAVIAAGATLLGLYARVFRRDGQLIAVAAFLLGIALVGAIAQGWWRDTQAAQLVDVTTDLETPPAFTHLMVRPDRITGVPVPNRPGYASLSPEERWRAVHTDAYPALKPVVTRASPASVVARARRAAEGEGWQVVAADPGHGHLELTATSRFLGFKDDLVLRAQPVPGGSRVDVRGVARTGTSDHGRIARLIGRLQQAVR
ncbi:DUF1499 domain-containing protein [Sphingomonas sp. BN140010]|uniref:DUF1499 domain-containing protein n=1 Tax=Sphingomonas arvum TaxID=2992113 RepID=A0ABT3JI24_9SPHN|nr:DUF1499 domain-containing protein [Sphingomonas sp. BN140010]MCW3798705.1 DUF1499 domain-containing protein [Sphingomonas sp. BN140010]